MFEFAINDLIKNISFAINEIRVAKIVFDELFIFIIIIVMSEHNNIILFDYKYITLFVHYVVNNQIEFDYLRIIKHMKLNINYHKNIINFIEFYEKKLNEIKLRQ